MRPDFETGVMLGQALEQIKSHAGHLSSHATLLEDHGERIEKIEGKLALAGTWVGRLVTAASLWAASLGIHLNAETIGQFLARLWRAAGPAGPA